VHDLFMSNFSKFMYNYAIIEGRDIKNYFIN